MYQPIHQRFHFSQRIWATLLLLTGLSAPVLAEEEAPVLFGDWQLFCNDPSDAFTQCFIGQVLVDRQGVKLSQISAGYHGESPVLHLYAPLGIHLEKGLILEVGDLVRRLSFQTCTLDGCRAISLIDDTLLAALILESQFTIAIETLGGGGVHLLTGSLEGFVQGLGITRELAAQTSPRPPAP